jgi:hypothetical protein
MSALEYLTGNSLTSHPFKVCRGTVSPEENQIAADWFYDILFVSFKDTVRSVFISNITKNVYGDLLISFSNVETAEFIAEITIVDTEVMDHYKNPSKSFASAANEYFAVKILLGPGLVAKASFSQDYTATVAELSSAAIVLNSPRLNQLTFEAYDGHVSSEPFAVHSFNYPEVPTIQLKHNAAFSKESSTHGSLLAQRGLGEGLYDACPTGNITDVYSLNTIQPDTRGSLFLNISNCYTAEVLTENSAVLFGAYSQGGELYKYRAFETYNALGAQTTFDAVQPQHALVLQNFCKPKCPPESLNAFAYYLNRVTDGAAELDRIATGGVETRGKGEASSLEPRIFIASSFCDPADTTFQRCNDPSQEDAYISCGQGFVKYFHEGRTLQLHYDNLTTRDYTIVEVLDTNRVRLDTPPTQTTQLSFRVLDNGVFSNINCATSLYNESASTFKLPYYKVKYTTSESFNGSGEYMTYLAIVVSVFNPSTETTNIHAAFTHSSGLAAQSGFKIRKNNDVQFSDTASFTLGCREYASVETVYSLHCNTEGGALDVEIFTVLNNQQTQIGNTYSLRNIKGAECPGTVAGQGKITRVLQSTGGSYTDTITLNDGINQAVLYGTAPSWFSFTPDYEAKLIQLSAKSTPTETVNKRYGLYYRSYGGALAGVVSQLTVDYVATPEIVAPLASRYTLQNPLAVAKDTQYTEENPVLEIVATNMTRLSNDFPSDLTSFVYSCSGLPPGLSLVPASGKIIGQLESSVSNGQRYTLNIAASNPSGTATNPQALSLIVPYNDIPELSFSSTTPGDTFIIDNAAAYSADSPLVQFTATNPPIYRYTLTGDLPAGLVFSSSLGQVTGQVTSSVESSSSFSVIATNYYGQSSPLTFSINVTKIYSKPSIVFPTKELYFEIATTDEYTKESPLFNVLATQAEGETTTYTDCDSNFIRNRYTALNLPPGFTLDVCSGDVYGSVAQDSLPAAALAGAAYSRTYPTRIYATNPVGRASVDVYMRVYSHGVPIINDAAPSRTITINRNYTYTEDSPLYSISALNSPTSYTVAGLPDGLYCSSSGKIIGFADPTLPAKDYTVTIVATNAFGSSAPFIKPFTLLVGLKLENAPENNIYSTTLGQNYAELATFISSGVDDLSDQVTIASTSRLPSGLSFVPPYITGTVANNATTGTYVVRVTASTTKYGTSYIDFSIVVSPVSYHIFGGVYSTDASPIEGAAVSYGTAASTTTTLEGTYVLNKMYAGSYNVTVSKEGYIFTPNYRRVDVSSADVYNVSFTGEGPLRLVQGTITLDGSPLKGITVKDSTDSYSTTTDSFGLYNLYVNARNSVSVIPVSTAYAFDPVSISFSPDSVAILGGNFLATSASAASAPYIFNITSTATTLQVYFDSPDSDGGASITNYQYSLNGGNTWTTSSPAKTTSPIQISGLVSGTQYRVKIRAINAAGAGAVSNTYYATPQNSPEAPTITEIVSSSGQLQVKFTAGANGGATITNYSYSLDGGQSWLIRSPANTASPITITGLTNGTTYSVSIKAINSAGAGLVSEIVQATPSASPNAPTITQIISGDGALDIYFTPPGNNGGAEITNYAYSLDNGANYTIQDPASVTSPISVSGLVNGVSYSVIVAAINANGQTPSVVYIASPSTVPDAPVITGITISNNRLYVAFLTPANNGSTITDYQYAIIPDDSYQAGNTTFDSFISAATTTSPALISNLTDGVKYHVVLRAINAAGNGAASTESEDTPGAAPTPPSAPLNPYAPEEQIDNLNIYFDPPANLGNAPVLYYQYSLNNSTTWQTPYPAVTASPLTVYDLVKARSYAIRVRAVNAGGAGAASVSVQASVVGGPSAPTGLKVTSKSESLSVAFTAPTNNGGGGITDYEYAVNAPDYDLFYSLNTTASPVTIPGLINGVNYSLVLRAVNTYGPGASSQPVSGTPATLPDAPVNLSLQAGNGTLTISFTAAYGGGAEITNYLYNINGSSLFLSANKTYSPIVVSNLTNNTNYTITLKAVNSVGKSVASLPVTGRPLGQSTAPTLVQSVSSPRGGSLSIPFNTPTNNGGYVLTNYMYSVDGGEFIARSPASTASPIVINNLTNSVSHSIRILAVNAGNFYSAASNAVTGTPLPSLCSAPRNLNAAGGNGQLTVSFLPPADLGGDLDVLYYEYVLNGGLSYTSTGSVNTSFTLSGLVNGVTYSVSVRAVNTATGTPPAANTTGIPYTTPAAPSNLSYQVPYGDTIPNIYLTAPDAGGLTITDYQYSINGGVFTSAGSGLPVILPRLDRNTTYSVAVRAANQGGPGPSTSISVSVLSLPEAPTLLALAPTLTTLTASFTPSANPGVGANQLPVLNYRYSIDGGKSFKLCSPAATTSPIVISSGLIDGVNTSLVTGTPYSIALQAISADGYGAVSNIITQVPGTLPAAPVIASTRAVPGGFDILSTAQDPGSSPITGYLYSITGPNGPWIAGTQYHMSAALAYDTAYTIYAKAVTLVGTSPISAPVNTLQYGPTHSPYDVSAAIYTSGGTNYLKINVNVETADLIGKYGGVPSDLICRVGIYSDFVNTLPSNYQLAYYIQSFHKAPSDPISGYSYYTYDHREWPAGPSAYPGTLAVITVQQLAGEYWPGYSGTRTLVVHL